MIPLKPGQNLLLNDRLWGVWQVTPKAGRQLALEAISASEASLGMTRRFTAFQYGAELFIEQPRGGYWRANLEQDWLSLETGPALNCRPATALDVLAVHTCTVPLESPNEFSWSYSRSAKYEYCPRAYYYHYYGAWEGWQPDAPEPVQTAYLLKNLSSLPQWTSALVHQAIKYALARLKSGRPVANDDLIRQMHRRAQADFQDSQQGRYQQRPNQIVGFQEHYYDTALDKSVWQAAWQQAEQYLSTFLNSTLYADLGRQPAPSFLDVDTLSDFSLAGTKIWVQLDLACRTEEAIRIFEWKTGQVDEEAVQQQLGVYGLYIRRRWPEWADVPLHGIVYALAEDRLMEFELDAARLEAAQTKIEAGIAHLQSLLLDSGANLAEIENFPMIDDLTICRRCQFRALCGR